MNARGSSRLDAPRAQVYARLSDPTRLQSLLPSVESVDELGDGRLSVRVAPQTALGATPLELELSIRERRDPEHVQIDGSGDGGEFRTTFEVRLEFAEHGSGTEVTWEAAARFDGLLSSIGQRILPALLAAQVDAVLRAAAVDA